MPLVLTQFGNKLGKSPVWAWENLWARIYLLGPHPFILAKTWILQDLKSSLVSHRASLFGRLAHSAKLQAACLDPDTPAKARKQGKSMPEHAAGSRRLKSWQAIRFLTQVDGRAMSFSSYKRSMLFHFFKGRIRISDSLHNRESFLPEALVCGGRRVSAPEMPAATDGFSGSVETVWGQQLGWKNCFPFLFIQINNGREEVDTCVVCARSLWSELQRAGVASRGQENSKSIKRSCYRFGMLTKRFGVQSSKRAAPRNQKGYRKRGKQSPFPLIFHCATVEVLKGTEPAGQ